MNWEQSTVPEVQCHSLHNAVANAPLTARCASDFSRTKIYRLWATAAFVSYGEVTLACHAGGRGFEFRRSRQVSIYPPFGSETTLAAALLFRVAQQLPRTSD